MEHLLKVSPDRQSWSEVSMRKNGGAVEPEPDSSAVASAARATESAAAKSSVAIANLMGGWAACFRFPLLVRADACGSRRKSCRWASNSKLPHAMSDEDSFPSCSVTLHVARVKRIEPAWPGRGVGRGPPAQPEFYFAPLRLRTPSQRRHRSEAPFGESVPGSHEENKTTVRATTKMPASSTGTFQPLRHRSGTMRERLHAYTKRTLGAGGSYNDAVGSALSDRIFLVPPCLRRDPARSFCVPDSSSFCCRCCCFRRCRRFRKLSRSFSAGRAAGGRIVRRVGRRPRDRLLQ